MPSPPPSPRCPSCSGRLESDGVCLTCFFQEAATIPESADGAQTEGTARVPFTLLGRLEFPCAFGRYRLLRELGDGGMGVVYEAEDPLLKRKVALKLIRAAAFARPEELARFRAEAEWIARLDHPGIVPVYEVGECQGQPYFTMKLLPGGTLVERLRNGPVPPREAARLLVRIARAVQHAHEHGVLHRDLKPGNVLLDAAGVPHLTDFGLARPIDLTTSLTVAVSYLGTPPYMSPEQARGRLGDVTVASDVWALGVLLYQMLSGHLPFTGNTPQEIFERILQEEPAPLAHPGLAAGSKVWSGVGPDLQTLLQRCLEKEPAKRLAGAAELAEELERWLAGEPIRCRPVTRAERAWKWMRRHPYRVAGLSLLAVSVLSGSLATLGQWRRAEMGARVARQAEAQANENAYFALLAQALASRQQGELGHARRLLESLPAKTSQFEWRLLNWLCRGDEASRLDLGSVQPRVMAWEPGRQRLALLGEDRRLRWLRPGDGSMEEGPLVPDPFQALAPRALEKGFHTLEFSPDGAHFFCGDGDVFLLAETATGRLIHAAAGRHAGGVWLDRQRVLYAGNVAWAARPDQSAEIYDLAAARTVKLSIAAFAPLALDTTRTRLAWTRHQGRQRAVEIVPVAALAANAFERIEVVQTTEEFPAHLTFAPDGQHLGLALASLIGRPKTAAVLALTGRQPLRRFELPTVLHGLAFSPEEPVLAVAGEGQMLRTFYYLQPRPESATYDDATEPGDAQPVPIHGPQQPPANLLSRSAYAGQVQFYLGHEELVRGVAFLPGADGLTTISDDRTLRRWPRVLAAPQSRVGGLKTDHAWEYPAVSVDGRFVLYRATDQLTHLWDRKRPRHHSFPPGHFPLAVRRDGRSVTRLAETGEIFQWSTPGDSGAAPQEEWRVRGIASHPGFGQVIRGVLARDDRTLVGLIPGKLLSVDLETRATTGTGDERMLHGPSGVNGLDLSPDGRWVAVTGLLGRRVRLYQTAHLRAGHLTLGRAEDYDTTAAFDPRGERLLVGNEDGRVRVFDLATREELPGESWRAHSGAVTALVFSADGELVATSGDRRLQFWDARGGAGKPRRERLRVSLPVPRNWMQFADGDRLFLHAAPDHALEAWEAP